MLTPLPESPAQPEQQVSVVTRIGSSTVKFIMNYPALVSFNHFHTPATVQDAVDQVNVNIHEYKEFYVGNSLLVAFILMPFQFILSSTIYALTLMHLYSQSGSTLAETPFNRVGLFAAYTYIYVGLLVFDRAIMATVVYVLTMTTLSFFHAACFKITQTSTTEDVV